MILRIDPALMKIARDRADVMAATDKMSHTEPDGSNVFDRMNAAELTLVRRRRDHRLEHLPGAVLDGRGDPRLDGIARPPRDHGLDRLQLRRLRGGHLVVGQALLRRRVRQGTRPHGPVGEVRQLLAQVGRSTHKRVTVRWSGGDSKLQVLTSGLAPIRGPVAGASAATGTPGRRPASTSRSMTLVRGVAYEFRLRARDKAGNIGTWRTVGIRP